MINNCKTCFLPMTKENMQPNAKFHIGCETELKRLHMPIHIHKKIKASAKQKNMQMRVFINDTLQKGIVHIKKTKTIANTTNCIKTIYINPLLLNELKIKAITFNTTLRNYVANIFAQTI